MQTAKLYHTLVVVGAGALGVGIAGCGDDSTGTGQEPVDGTGGAPGHGGSSAAGTSNGGAANGCADKCHTQSNGWKICSGVCCWLDPSGPCCN
ncbi:MAG TPA: hypothetical protein VHE30_24320 [Polyangiaceae bacterium]|nr:hypothetical protein [Polyangiaceae bacterium]